MRDEHGLVICRGRAGDALFTAYEPQVMNDVLLLPGDSLRFVETEYRPAFAAQGWVGYLLRFLLPPRHRSAIIGDWLEEFAEVERDHGTAAAMRLCAWDVFCSVIRLAIVAKIVHWLSRWAK
jgi:hypothetical protein